MSTRRQRGATVLELGHRPKSLLGPNWGKARDQLLFDLGAACAQITGNGVMDFGMWHRAQAALMAHLREALEKLDLEATEWAEKHLYQRLNPPGIPNDREGHLRLWAAVLTDGTRTFWNQFTGRTIKNGNVHLGIMGGTGLAKSSEAVEIMDTVKPFPADQLLSRLGLNASEKADKLPLLHPGDTYQDDDELEMAGEGSITTAKNDRNTAATLRYSGIHYIRIAPDLEAAGTDQGVLEALFVSAPRIYVGTVEVTADSLWDPEVRRRFYAGESSRHCRACRIPWAGDYCKCGWRPWTLNLLHVGAYPMGLVGIYWMKADKFAKYDPWKAENTRKTLKQQYGDLNETAKLLNAACEDPRFAKYIVKRSKGKSVTLKIFKAAFRQCKPRMVAGSIGDAVADLAYDVCFGWEYYGETSKKTGKTVFEEEWYDFAPHPDLAVIAKHCRKE